MLRDRLVAHRGYQRKYPENTLLAMREAVAAGAHFLETDIQLTEDKLPVLYHDMYLSRISGSTGKISELDLAAAQSLSAHEPSRLGKQFPNETVTSLEEFVGFLRQNKNVKAFVEIKAESITEFGRQVVFEAIESAVAEVCSQVILISFDVEIIAIAKQHSLAKTGVVLTHWDQIESPQLKSICPDYLFTNVKLIPNWADLNALEPLLVVYEIDQPQKAIELFDRGVDMVETFDIGGMIANLSAHNL